LDGTGGSPVSSSALDGTGGSSGDRAGGGDPASVSTAPGADGLEGVAPRPSTEAKAEAAAPASRGEASPTDGGEGATSEHGGQPLSRVAGSAPAR